ncbi:MAG: hypothetical protein ACPGNT_01685 [Rhodospirillales bacterium]
MLIPREVFQWKSESPVAIEKSLEKWRRKIDPIELARKNAVAAKDVTGGIGRSNSPNFWPHNNEAALIRAHFAEAVTTLRESRDSRVQSASRHLRKISSLVPAIEPGRFLNKQLRELDGFLTGKASDCRAQFKRRETAQWYVEDFLTQKKWPNLPHEPAYDRSPYKTFFFMFVCWIGESLLNVGFLKGGSDFGLSGAFIEALALSAINIGGTFLFGWGSRWAKSGQKILARLLGGTSALGFIGIAGGFNLFGAHYRAEVNRSLETVYQAAFDKFLSDPFGLTDPLSIFFLIFAILIAGISGWKGYQSQSSLPGFAPLARKRDAEREAADNLKNEILEELETRFDFIREELDSAPSRGQEMLFKCEDCMKEILSAVSAAENDFDDLNLVYNAVIQEFRATFHDRWPGPKEELKIVRASLDPLPSADVEDVEKLDAYVSDIKKQCENLSKNTDLVKERLESDLNEVRGRFERLLESLENEAEKNIGAQTTKTPEVTHEIHSEQSSQQKNKTDEDCDQEHNENKDRSG